MRPSTLLAVRVALGAFGFIGALAAPPWVPVVCIVLLSLRFAAWEAIFLGLFIDFAWLPAHPSLQAFPFATLAALLVVWGFAPIRRELMESGPTIMRPGWE